MQTVKEALAEAGCTVEFHAPPQSVPNHESGRYWKFSCGLQLTEELAAAPVAVDVEEEVVAAVVAAHKKHHEHGGQMTEIVITRHTEFRATAPLADDDHTWYEALCVH